MSTNIIYDKQFIKLNNNTFIPVLYAGSSNCYEVGRNGRNGRRDRSWYANTYYTQGKLAATATEIINAVEANKVKEYQRTASYNVANSESCITLADFEKGYGWQIGLSINGSTRRTTFAAYKNIYATGIKQAMTVEELVAKNVTVRVYIYSYDDKKMIVDGVTPFDTCVETNEELMSIIAQKEVELAGTKYVLSLTIDADERKMKQLRGERKVLRPKLMKPKKEVTESFVFFINGYGYYVKSTKYGFRYTPYETAAYTLYNNKEAERKLIVLNDRHIQNIEMQILQLKEPQLV